MLKSTKILLIVTAVIVGLLLVLKSSPSQQFNADRLTLTYPTDYMPVASTAKPTADDVKVLLSLHADKPFRDLVLVREKNAIKGAQITRANFLDFLENNALATLPMLYPEYERSKTERMTLDGYQTTLVTFKYIGTDKKTAVYAQLLISPVGNDAYHLTIESLEQKQLEKDMASIIKNLQID